MDMTGERRIPVPRERVWNALNDPEVLRSCIPGCESLEKTAENEMKATAAVKIGPIAARFNGKVHLADLDPPNAYTISGEGQGGVAGFAKGGAKVNLVDDAGATLLRYAVQAQVGGKIAQLGARLIDATAKSMADQFFDRFTGQLTLGPPTEPVVTQASNIADAGATPETYPTTSEPFPTHRDPPPPATVSMWSLIPREPFGLPIVAWIGAVLFLFVLLLLYGGSL
jgi:carbon monoxide dehydrogenase subunit G